MPQAAKRYRDPIDRGSVVRPLDIRPPANVRGYDHRWRRFRAGYLMHHPLCAMCEAAGRTTLAKLIDHIIPLAQGGSKYNHANLQGLCYSCHAKKHGQDRKERL